jgi:hypothetical protein
MTKLVPFVDQTEAFNVDLYGGNGTVDPVYMRFRDVSVEQGRPAVRTMARARWMSPFGRPSAGLKGPRPG